AALAVPQLERLETINDQRRANAAVLLDLLDGTDIGLPIVPEGRRPVWHQFTVLLPAGTDRDTVGLRMREAGVETGAYYPRLAWDYPVYREHPGVVADDTPTARDAAARCLSLPVHPGLSEGDLEGVAKALLAAVEPARPDRA